MNSLDELLNIDTPENVTFDYEVAGIGSRFMAAFVDTTLIGLIVLAIALVVLQFVGSLLDVFSDAAQSVATAVTILLIFTVVWGYYIFFEVTWAGQTPGKRWVGLRVIGTNGLPVSAVSAIIRNIVRIVDFFPSGYGVGLIAMFLHPQARRLGDLAAGTLVVFDQTAVTLESLGRESKYPTTAETAFPPEMATLPLHLLSKRQIEAMEYFLTRRYELSNRKAMGQQLHQQAYQSMGTTPAPHLTQNAIENELRHMVQAHKK